MNRHLLWIALAILVAIPGGAAAEPPALPEIPVLRSEDGALSTTLRLAYARNVIRSEESQDTVELRSYNGRLVGPVLSMRPGD
ncbi:hypothetical protein EHM82_05620, partial [bacterium]